jgi:hypothetical protein
MTIDGLDFVEIFSEEAPVDYGERYYNSEMSKWFSNMQSGRAGDVRMKHLCVVVRRPCTPMTYFRAWVEVKEG